MPLISKHSSWRRNRTSALHPMDQRWPGQWRSQRRWAAVSCSSQIVITTMMGDKRGGISNWPCAMNNVVSRSLCRMRTPSYRVAARREWNCDSLPVSPRHIVICTHTTITFYFLAVTVNQYERKQFLLLLSPEFLAAYDWNRRTQNIAASEQLIVNVKNVF